MNTKKLLLLPCLLLLLSSCAVRQNIVKPDIWPAPHFQSVVVDKNDTTGEEGFWFSRPDVNTLGVYIQHNENLRGSY